MIYSERAWDELMHIAGELTKENAVLNVKNDCQATVIDSLKAQKENLEQLVRMYRERDKEDRLAASSHAQYPKGQIVGPCICGSWPGGECLKCRRVS